MIFNSIEFILLFFVTLFTFHFIHEKYKIFLFFIVSSIFYSYLYAPYLLILYFIIIIDFYFSSFIYKSKSLFYKKIFLIISIVSNISILIYFKYSLFFVDVLNNFVNISTPEILVGLILPVGLSFHTFQSLSYVFEVYKGKFIPETNLLKYASYVMFFPQLVAGPIERPQNVLPQFNFFGKLNSKNFFKGLEHILLGLFKKVVIADTIADFINIHFSDPASSSSSLLLLSTVLFSFQIYYDFSGYSSMAIGLAKIFNIDLMKNFDKPYLSSNLKEFWTRWHISLSTWFRDYLYIPLGGSRYGKYVTNRNLLIVFLVSGLWHGANYTFIIWGGLHGLVLILQSLNFFKISNTNNFKILIKIIFNFCLVTLLWLFFRADNIDIAMLILDKLTLTTNYNLVDVLNISTILKLSIFIIFIFEITYRYFESFTNAVNSRDKFIKYSYFFILSSLIILIGNWGDVTFIYFQF